ncbi:MAG: protease inhibitor I42 family protein [Betaproteobacteria bacterium]|nr:protease inhibitor I42 family protein [Betaproteobacteria bacterium]
MKKIFSAVFVVVLTSSVLAGCATRSADTDKTLSLSYSTIATEALNGANIPMEVGQQLDVRLRSNHATGHQWVQTEPMRGALRDASPRYEVLPTPEGAEPNPSAGGTEIFSFTAARPGTQVLVFEYRRSWETDEQQEAIKTISYQITVN